MILVSCLISLAMVQLTSSIDSKLKASFRGVILELMLASRFFDVEAFSSDAERSAQVPNVRDVHAQDMT